MSRVNYSIITETPRNKASSEQLSMLQTRYHVAAKQAMGKDVLEVACGAGLGLKYLAQYARSVIAGDIDDSNLQIAIANHSMIENVNIQHLDAQDLQFPENSFDLVLFYEAVYYLDDPIKFTSEAYRVLRPGGTLILVSVNCNWSGFNPSPFSTNYLIVPELYDMLTNAGFSVSLYGAFPDIISGIKQRIISLIRKVAVKLHFIPKSMRAKKLLKRLFMGNLHPIPSNIEKGLAPLQELTIIKPDNSYPDFKVIYAFATKSGNTS